MSKLLSIVIPVYKVEKYIDKCISSLIVPDANASIKSNLQQFIRDSAHLRNTSLFFVWSSAYGRSGYYVQKETPNNHPCGWL